MSENLMVGKPTDGPIARHLHLNRRLSLPISRAIVRSKLPISPLMMTLISFAVWIGSSLLLAFQLALYGGLLAQLSSALDGCDGEIARLTRQVSPRGVILDLILDRIVDGAILLGMTLFAYQNAACLWPITFGFLSLIGSFGISYSSAIARAMGIEDYPQLPLGRDVRLFFIMLAGIVAAYLPGSMIYSLMLLSLGSLIALSLRLVRG